MIQTVPKWDLFDPAIQAALNEIAVPNVMQETMDLIALKLAQGIPVTLTFGDVRVATYFPGGKIEYHDGWLRPRCP